MKLRKPEIIFHKISLITFEIETKIRKLYASKSSTGKSAYKDSFGFMLINIF